MPETILIVDDSKFCTKLLRKYLRGAGFNTIEGYDGEQAIKLSREKLPNLILLDVIMPKINGFSACRIIKKDKDTKDIPIILVTSMNEPRDKVMGFDLGADDYVTKPYNFPELYARIKSLLNVRSKQKNLIQEEKNRTIDQMVDGVAHEVRNPIVSIGGFARRIFNDLPENDPKKKYAEIIMKETARLERMVRDIRN